MKYLFLIALLFSCLLPLTSEAQNKGKSQEIDIEFFIAAENTNLYTRIIGNPNKPIIIALHGGPGAFSLEHEFFRNVLEKDYLLVYFDQRGSGKSDEFRERSMLTTQQFVKDLDVVVDVIKNKYPNQKINLLGTSWGATYGLLYLIKHQDKINSFISNSGVADIQHSSLALIKHEKELATKLILDTNDTIKKNRFKEILTQLDVIEKSGFTNFFADMNTIRYEIPADLGFDVYWARPELKSKIEAILNDPEFYARVKYTPALFEQSMTRFEYINEVFHSQEAYNNLNILSELALIKTPTLIIQGEYDYAIGIESSRMTYNALVNVPKKDKKLIYVKNASHNVPTEAPEVLYKAFKQFLKKNN